MKKILDRVSRGQFVFAALFFCVGFSAQQNYTQYVNPFIGTGGHGHTFPGPVMPFGMVQLSPDTRIDGSWDGCSGYHYSDTLIHGFSHTHLSGTGCSDWGDILLMPSSDPEAAARKSYASRFSHASEKAGAGYYSVQLAKNNILVELTVTPRTGIHRYTFPNGTKPYVVLDLEHRDKTLELEMRVVDSNLVVGHRVSEAWAKKQTIYFAIRFSQRIKNQSAFQSDRRVQSPGSTKGNLEKAEFGFSSTNSPLMVKVGISPVSEEGALLNLDSEAPHWDFENYRQHAEAAWNKQLGKIEVSGTDRDQLTVFYTALYHCCIHPSLAMDVDGKYRGRDDAIHAAKGFTYYTVFSLWDTYRALHPLFTIIEQERTAHFLNTFLEQHKQSGRLPVWELSSNETDCMIGFHSVSVIADAMAKGIQGIDREALYQAALAASNYTGYGIPVCNKNGFLQVDDINESVSRTLEYGYDNWCVAQMAKLLQKPEDEKAYLKRSLAYRNLFDATTGHMRPRRNGTWYKPFAATEINNHYTEGNSWQYSFYVPHDVEGLMALYGGETNFERKLDELFETTQKTTGREQADVTGLIGQYAHGNEPSHHMAYLYNYCGSPHKAVQRVRYICDNFYKATPDGLIGNEDCGQMSAWYVFSALGMYPVCPGSTQYVLAKPVFSEMRVNLENGKTFSIKNDVSRDFISAFSINGTEGLNSFIEHADLLKGGDLEFLSRPKNTVGDNFGGKPAHRPLSAVRGINYIAAPLIESRSQVFKDTLTFAMRQLDNTVRFLPVFTLNRNDPNRTSEIFQRPLRTDSSCVVNGMLLSNEAMSGISTARYYRLKYDYIIRLQCRLHPQYTADSAQTLIDGIPGDSEWRKGNWLGLQGQDFVCVVDLKKPTTLSLLSLECLQDTPSWIVYPAQVSYFGSNDNKQFVPIAVSLNEFPVKHTEKVIKRFEAKPKVKAPYRYIKVVAKNAGKLPAWHPGAGGESFIFAGELDLK